MEGGATTESASRLRVRSKEAILKRMLKVLEAMHQTLSRTDIQSPDIDIPTWLSLIEKISTDSSKAQYRVGIAGDTGIGKTTLLNTLLGQKTSLAPESQSTACTSAVCRFHYNHDRRKGHRFRAVVHLKSKKTVEAELKKIFDTIKILVKRSTDEINSDEHLFNMQVEVEQNLRLVSSWSGRDSIALQTSEKRLGVAGITGSFDGADKLFNFKDPSQSVTRYESSDCVEEFQQIMRELMGVAAESNSRPLWPLIDVVDIYIISDILQNGIVLVDLPGERDALDARSAASRREYKTLDLILVATPSVRAADNNTAMSFIRRDQLVDLDSQGRLNENSIAMVITKADDLQWKEFEVTTTDSNKSEDFQEWKASHAAKSNELKEMQVKMLNLRDKNEQLILMQRYQELQNETDKLNGKCLRFCIDIRTSHIKTNCQKYFDIARSPWQGKKPSAERVCTSLPVFAVSSREQRQLLNGNKSFAFPDDMATGFRQLSSWIIENAMKRRELEIDQILCQCSSLFESIEAWASDDAHQQLRTLPFSRLEDLRVAIKSAAEKLTQAFKKPEDNFSKHLDMLKDQLCNTNETPKELQKRFIEVVTNFSRGPKSEKMHWVTFAACVVREGGLMKSSGRERRVIYWQGDLAFMYWFNRAAAFSTVPTFVTTQIEQSLLQSCSSELESHIASIWKGFSNSRDSKVLKPFKQRTENWVHQYRIELKGLGEQFRRQIQDLQEDLKETMAEHLRGMFEKAFKVKGRNKLERQKAEMKVWSHDNGRKVFAGLNECLEISIGAICDDLQRRIGEASRSVVDKLGDMEAKTRAGVGVGLLPSDQVDLQSDLQTYNEKWQQQWKAVRRIDSGRLVDTTSSSVNDSPEQSETDEETDNDDASNGNSSDSSETDESEGESESEDTENVSLKRQATDELSGIAKSSRRS